MLRRKTVRRLAISKIPKIPDWTLISVVILMGLVSASAGGGANGRDEDIGSLGGGAKAGKAGAFDGSESGEATSSASAQFSECTGARDQHAQAVLNGNGRPAPEPSPKGIPIPT